MMDDWTMKKLCDLADIRVSNVDKKTYKSEQSVQLCNYMDVYLNDYITKSIQFMEASANHAEIERFGLEVGDVIITKDSETPHDIGIPSVILEKIDNLVCGYHLALIRPDTKQIDSIFLAKYLSTAKVINYFSLYASGSTRFGLPTGVIESLEIPTPPHDEQRKIAEILSTIDRAISQTEAILKKQQRIKTGLMQDLLTKGIDEKGNIRREETHEFKDSPLGRIPVEWEVETFGSRVKESAFGPRFPSTAYSENGNFVLLRTTDVDIQGNILYENMPFVKLSNSEFDKHILKKGDLLITRSGTCGITSVFSNFDSPTIPGAFLIRFRLDQEIVYPEYVQIYFNWHGGRKHLLYLAEGGVQKNLKGSTINQMFFAFPDFNEQQRIIKKIDLIQTRIFSTIKNLEKLKYIKTALMQDLLTGKVRVTQLTTNLPP